MPNSLFHLPDKTFNFKCFLVFLSVVLGTMDLWDWKGWFRTEDVNACQLIDLFS